MKGVEEGGKKRKKKKEKGYACCGIFPRIFQSWRIWNGGGTNIMQKVARLNLTNCGT